MARKHKPTYTNIEECEAEIEALMKQLIQARRRISDVAGDVDVCFANLTNAAMSLNDIKKTAEKGLALIMQIRLAEIDKRFMENGIFEEED